MYIKKMLSHFNKDGVFIGNYEELVDPAQELPPQTTAEIFAQKKSMTGVFDGKKWQEIEDKTKINYWDKNALVYCLLSPLDSFPDWAIFEKPPKDKEVSLYDYNLKKWIESDHMQGKTIYKCRNSAHSNKGEICYSEELIGTAYYKLASHETNLPQPTLSDGKQHLIIDSEWVEVEDHRGETAYAIKSGFSDFIVNHLGQEITENHTLKPKPDYDHTWSDALEDWEITVETEQRLKREERNRELANSDKMMISDYTIEKNQVLSLDQKDELINFRQELRELTEKEDFQNTDISSFKPDWMK